MFFCGRMIASLLAILSLAVVANASEPEAVPGQFVVTLKESMNKSQLQNFRMDGHVQIVSVIETANAIVVQRNVAEKSQEAIKQLQADPRVRIAEPNYIYRINALPNDPELNQLWGLVNNGQDDPAAQRGVAGVDIGAEKAWDIQTSSPDIVIAVIDTGIDTNLEDLKDNLWVNEAELNGLPDVDDDGNGYVDDVHGYDFANDSGQLIDDNGHGSHVSGTIGASGNDGKGIVGVTWDVQMMGLKFLTGQGGGTLENAIKAIDYATNNGADIMSNSWGGGGYSEQLKEAIQRADAAGVLFVAASGNERNDNDNRATYPATYDVPNVLSVAAIDNQGKLASFSNWGKTKVHVAAPGVNVLSSTPGGLQSYSGTSMACPHVSGIAALLMANDSSLTAADVKARIMKTAKPLAGLRGRTATGGVANAYYALVDIMPPPDPNDPELWDNIAQQVSTPHPYENNFEQEYILSFPGAKKIAVYFDKFETENNFDPVTIIDGQGNEVGKLSGKQDATWSPVVLGDVIKLKIRSDRSIVKYGFDVSKIAYKMTDD